MCSPKGMALSWPLLCLWVGLASPAIVETVCQRFGEKEGWAYPVSKQLYFQKCNVDELLHTTRYA